MAKRFFRFLRGELNGYYLQKINEMLNGNAQGAETFLSEFSRMVFKTPAQVTGSEYPIPSDILDGISTIAGVFPPRVSRDTLQGSIRFTVSHKEQGEELSDEGLFNLSSDLFEFPLSLDESLYTNEGEGRNTQATPVLKSSLVESGAEILGFFREGDDVIKDDGTVDESHLIIPDVPYESWLSWSDSKSEEERKCYYPYYGKRYLYLSEEAPVTAEIGYDSFLEVVKAMQYIRYNGTSIKSLCSLASILCPSYVFILGIEWNKGNNYGIVYYGIDQEWEAEDKLLRTEVLKVVVTMKFKQLVLSEKTITVERDEEGNVISIEEVT